MKLLLQRTLISLSFLFSFACVMAQETTATLSGVISDAKGFPVTGASIVLKHIPTGYTSGTQSNSKGIFSIPNLKPGGPYTVTVSFTGMATQTLENVNLNLGGNPDGNVTLLTDDKSLKEVVVTGNKRGAGSGLTVGKVQMNTLPSIGRSLSDFTRVTPQSNNNSFAGSNFRYNNITLDGAINNDAIGFSNSFGGVSGGGQSGTAGSGTRTNPYSIDVIQEVQVQLAPYDVKLGNFTGGSVNAVTKSGTNDVHGSVYGYGRNQTLMGKSPDAFKTKIGSDFYDYQYGGTLSGPIIKNKLFFIVNAEVTRRQEPTFYNAGDPGAAITVAQAQDIANHFTTAGFDAGSYSAGKVFTKSNKFFGRIDYNINSKNTLTFRGIYTKGWGNNLERTPYIFQFSSTDFTQTSKNINLVTELKTKFNNSVSNQLILGYINVHDYRTYPNDPNVTPYADITNGATNVWLGTWREASIYNQHQKTVEFTDNVTVNKGAHKFTFGTHNEFYDFNYGFVNSWNGRWQYNSISDFDANKPSRVRSAYASNPDKNGYDDLRNNVPGSSFKVGLLSAYAEDEISITSRFKITPGLRVDYSYVGTQPPTDTALIHVPDNVNPTNPTYSHTPFSQFNNKWFGNAALSPRLGFNWDVNGNKSVVVRGGTGIFTGRIPFAWLGYAYTLSGANFNNIDIKSAALPGGVLPLVGPQNLVTTVGAISPNAIKTREVDLVDNHFKLPTVWRSNVAVDLKFGNGYKFTADVMYTKTIHDVEFQQINRKDVTQYYATGPTQTPIYSPSGSNSGQYSNIFLLSNTSEGYRYNLTAQLSKVTNNIRAGVHSTFSLNWSVAYTYGQSKDLANGIRNSMQSNWDYNPAVSPNNPQLAYSNFDLRSHFVALLGGSLNWNARNTTSLNFFYSGSSGSPYSLIYASTPGNIINGSSSLPYIPTAAESNTMILDPTNRAAFNAFVDGDSYLKTRRGQYAQRNGLRTPWNHDLDMKLMHEFKLSVNNKSHALQISFDVFNVLNLISNSWGHITFVSNTNNYTVNFLKFVADGNGKAVGDPSTGYSPTFQFLQPTGNHYYTNDPVNSRWQGQLGIHY
ncbi:MAG TPA: carboxypeptidase regulatory-like domain-containing protein, partial [Chitinophagaceae bacterium]|nr:carboxypeptidase regulatory-like domain-containing protein [Chitinophagaceae bacterium]